MRFLLEANPNALVLADEDGVITFANRKAAQAFGYRASELVGRPVDTLVPDRIRERHAHHRQTYHGAPRHRQMGIGIDLTGQRKDGSEFPVEVALSPFYLDGRRQVMAAIVDITERKEQETVREAFIDVLSHELRTPITTIYGSSQLLLRRDSGLDEKQRTEALVDLADEAERLNRIVENLVVLAKVDRGAEELTSEPVLVHRLLARVIEQERSHFPQLDLRLLAAEGLPAVLADDTHLVLVMRNLISNAAKYGPPAGPVDVVAEEANDEVLVRVLDRGVGLSTEDEARLFGLYYRSPRTSSTAPGAGIGLFACRHLIEAMGGRIWARPRPTGGSEFGFALPSYVE